MNQEFHLNWTLAAYFQRVQDRGLKWTATERAGRRLTLAERLPEHLREACFEDPAWEARNGWVDRLVCRACFNIFHDGAMDGAPGHLRTIHKWRLKEYRLRHPEAPIFTIERIASVDVQQYMREIADSYATPEERTAADKDGKYEVNNKITKYVICRIPRCGRKVRSLTRHLQNAHEISGEAVADYRRQHDWAPIHCQEVRERSSSRNSRRLARLKARAARTLAPKRGRPRDVGKLDLMVKLLDKDLSLSAMRHQIYPETPTTAYTNTRQLFSRNRVTVLKRCKPATRARLRRLRLP